MARLSPPPTNTPIFNREGRMVPVWEDFFNALTKEISVLDLVGILTVAQGGTALPALPAHAVLIGAGVLPTSSTGPGAVGTVLTGNGPSADPTFQLPTTSGTVTHTSGALTNHAVMVGNGAADADVLASLGAVGQVLTSLGAGVDPVFQDIALARSAAYGVNVQSINDSTFTAVTFDSNSYDVGAVHSTTVNPSRFTVPSGADGVYLFAVVVAFATHATGQRILTVTVNGVNLPGNGYIIPSASGVYVTGMAYSIVMPLVAGDYVEAFAYQNSGGPLNIGFTSTTATHIQNRAQLVRLSS